MRKLGVVAVALFFAALPGGPASRADGPDPARRTLDIHVDATGRDDLAVRLEVAGLEKGDPFWVKRVVDEPLYTFRDIEIHDVGGRLFPHVIENQRFVVKDWQQDRAVVTYRVKPGGLGRHGHQGLMADDWVGFDGRAVLQPREIADYDDVRWHFTLPEGWSVASSMLPIDADSFAMPDMEPRYRASVLKSLCVGLGDFQADTRKLGAAEVRVYTMKRWQDGAELAEKAHSVFRWFHDELRFEPTTPFALVWSPAGPEMKPVWSGAGATAVCYERPQAGFHNWELLGHRIAHPMNEYPPSGFAITPARDHWFMEGWATYIERKALAGAGIAGRERWNDLLSHHHQELADHPEWADAVLAEELAARGDLVENLHYRRGALAVAMLADQLERRSGKTLEQFMVHVFATHGGFQKGLDLRKELASWSGAPLDDVWTALVDQPGPVVPVWAEVEQALPATRPGPALRVGKLSWSADQLFGMLASGHFEGAVAVADALRETGRKHEELARRGVAVLPPAVAELRAALSPRVREDVDALERSWPLDGGPPLPSGGCGGASEPVPLPALEPVSDDGRLFLDLVEAERRAQPLPAGREGLLGIRFGEDERSPEVPLSVLAIEEGQKLRVMMGWEAPRPGMHLEVWNGDQRVARRWVEVQSDWRTTWMRLGPDVLGDATGILDVRLVADGQVVGSRPVWRRAP